MLTQIDGLHHVTAMGRSASGIDGFYTRALGLRRVKKTVNFDAPHVYHLYYGDGTGSPGSVMTYFPFPDIGRRRPGAGEVGSTTFAVPPGALDFWEPRLAGLVRDTAFGAARLRLTGPEGEELALVEAEDGRTPWSGGGVPGEAAIRRFHGVSLRLRETAATGALLEFMGFVRSGTEGAVSRFARPEGNGARTVDLEAAPDAAPAAAGAGLVHHVAFAVPDREAQRAVRQALIEAGESVTPVIDRDYFWAIYFRSPGGVLFEVATGEPGFDRDEDAAHLGETLRLPGRHAHLRARLEAQLEPLE